MKDYRLLRLLFAASGIAILTMANAAAQTTPKEAANPAPSSNSSASNELRIAQARSQAAGEADAKTKREAQLAARQKLITSSAELIKNGHPQEAYNLLAPYQSIMAGDVDYDYLLGLAAVDSGKPNEAIFALERVLAVRPNHLQARAEIARAYLAAGEIAASKQEFETVQAQNPPQEVSATIQKYLDIIETDRSGKKTSIRGYIEAMLGNDSNVNSATSNRQIAVPYFGGAVMNLNSAGVANSDTFGSLGAGFNVRHALSPEWALLGGANVNQHNNSTQQAFNTGSADANFGASLSEGNDNYMAVLQVQSFALDNKRYRDAAGMTGQWQRNLDSGSQVSGYFQYSSLTYPDQTFRNADRYVLGGAYATPLGGESATVVYAGAYAGAEQARESNASYIGNTLFGGRLGGEMKLNTEYTLLASLSLESRMYGGDDPLFLVKRNDTQADVRVGINYVPAQQWTIGASLAYTSNDSNVIINKYERTLFSVSVRRDFN
jgi:tetratricopeptide (TPR) repeat protein